MCNLSSHRHQQLSVATRVGKATSSADNKTVRMSLFYGDIGNRRNNRTQELPYPLTFIHCSQVDSLPVVSTNAKPSIRLPIPNEAGNSSKHTWNQYSAIIGCFRCNQSHICRFNSASWSNDIGNDGRQRGAFDYWRRLVLYLDDLGNKSLRCSHYPANCQRNGGVAKTKCRWQNGGTRDILVAVVLRFCAVRFRAMRQRVVGNFGCNWLKLFCSQP